MRLLPIIVLMSLFATGAVRGDENAARKAAEKVKEGNGLLEQGQFADALAAYDEAAQAMPESAEVAYNRGIALYRMGEYEKATKALQDALKPEKPELEAKVKYNLGRSAHEAAIANHEKAEEAIKELSKAVSFYKDALALNDKDADAKKNMEEAERFRAFLEKRLKEQQEQKQKNPSSQPTSQPDKKEPTSQPDKQQTSQPSSQPQDDQQDKDKGDQKKDDQGKEDEKDQEQQKQDQQKKGEKGKDKDKSRKDAGKENQSDADKQDGQQGQEGQEDKEQKMKADQVEPMLQEARDAEKARREAKHAKMMRMRGKIPVKKDW